MPPSASLRCRYGGWCAPPLTPLYVPHTAVHAQMLEAFRPLYMAATAGDGGSDMGVDLWSFLLDNEATLTAHGTCPSTHHCGGRPSGSPLCTSVALGRYAFLLQEARGSHSRVRVPPGLPAVSVREVRDCYR
jgi:hypothetical protein